MFARTRTSRLLGHVARAGVALGACGCFASGGDPVTSAPPLAGSDASSGSATLSFADAGNAVALDAGPTPVDSSVFDVPDAAPLDSGSPSEVDACTGSVAVVGGTVAGASTIAFAATFTQGRSWVVTSLPSNVASPPAIVAFAGDYVAAFVDASGDLEFATSTWSWSSPAALAGRAAKGAPSLAAVGSSLHVVYQGTDSKYLHGIYSAGGGWDAAGDPIGGASKQGFGPSAPAAASVAGMLTIAYGGQNGSLYDETWAADAWVPDTQHAATQIGTLAPAIVPLTGGASDTLIVYASPSGTLYSTSRSAGAWSMPAVTDVNAFTNAPPSLLALSAGRAMIVYLGTNGLPYFSLYSPGASPLWTSPAAVGTGTPKLASAPSIAAGVCGDDAIAVLVESAGVATIRYAGGMWLSPTLLAGTAGMTFASVASQR